MFLDTDLMKCAKGSKWLLSETFCRQQNQMSVDTLFDRFKDNLPVACHRIFSWQQYIGKARMECFHNVCE